MSSIPVVGAIKLEDGVLRFYNQHNEVCGELYVGSQGAVYEQVVGKGEFTFLQVDDPPSVKLCSMDQNGDAKHLKLGKVSYGLMRHDGIAEEMAYISGATAEDSNFREGDLRGQLEMFIRPDTTVDAQQVFVATTSYSEELAIGGIDPRTGVRRIWTGLRNVLLGLWKFD